MPPSRSRSRRNKRSRSRSRARMRSQMRSRRSRMRSRSRRLRAGGRHDNAKLAAAAVGVGLTGAYLWSQNKKKKNKNVPAVVIPPLKGYPPLPPPTELKKEIKRYEDMSDDVYAKEVRVAAESDHPLPVNRLRYVVFLSATNMVLQKEVPPEKVEKFNTEMSNDTEVRKLFTNIIVYMCVLNEEFRQVLTELNIQIDTSSDAAQQMKSLIESLTENNVEFQNKIKTVFLESTENPPQKNLDTLGVKSN